MARDDDDRDDVEGLPAVRIGDADRSRVVELLRAHCGAGRLTLDEFSERVGDVFLARTGPDLERVLADLPVLPEQGRPDTAAPVARVAAEEASRTMAVMGANRRNGRFRVRGRTSAVAVMGGVEVDFRRAEVFGAVIDVRATAIMGGVKIVVPEGVPVELSGTPIMGNRKLKVADVPVIPGAPVIRVRARVLWGNVLVVSKPAIHADPRASRAVSGGPAALRPPPSSRANRPPRERDRERDRDRARRKPEVPDGTVTILFSDIQGFTAMTDRLGDLRAHQLLAAHNDVMRKVFADHGAYEVKAQGDGFMVAFSSAARALRCALAAQAAIGKWNASRDDEPLLVRMGLHTGEAIREGGDFLGNTVNLASRIGDEAKGGEVLVSSLLRELTIGTGEFDFGDARQVWLKGLADPRTIYSVAWKPE